MDVSRNELLKMSDAELLDQCRCENFRASGPGGQHRNTTDSAVRLTLKGTKIKAYASTSRSQFRNRLEAIKKLRFEIVLRLREENVSSWKGQWKVGKNDIRYPQYIAQILDVLSMNKYRLGEAAKVLQISTGRLNRILSNDLHLWKYVNEKRNQFGLRPLRN